MVRNPFAKDLAFGSTRLRSRRDHQKYLDLINVMALVHQYQREIKSTEDIDGAPFQYIEVNREDIARVDAIMREIRESDRGLSIISDRFDADGFGSWIGSGGIHALVPILCAVLEASLMWFGLR